jgi:signal peptide peptidase SppA
MLYERVIAYVRSTPWAILPSYVQTMVEVLTLRANGIRLSDEEIAARVAAGRAARGSHGEAPKPASIAVVPVWGVISHRMAAMDDLSSPGGASAEQLTGQIRALANDADISAIVLDVDSPGGSVFGVPELAEEIRAARAKKPIIAVANAMAASAAYWLASQATEFVVTPSGQVGSIGVYTLHEDLSESLKAEGIEISVVKAGKYKIEGNPFGPLDDEARAALQKEVDSYYSMFTKDVAKGRGVDVEAVRNGFAEGRMANAKDAVALGMADRVATLDEVLADLVAGKLPSSARAAADPFEITAESIRADVAAAEEEFQRTGKEPHLPTSAAPAAEELAEPAPSAEEPLEMYLRRMRLRNLELGAM